MNPVTQQAPPASAPPTGEPSGPRRHAALQLVGGPPVTRQRLRELVHMWRASETFCVSERKPDIVKVPAPLFKRLVESLTYTA